MSDYRATIGLEIHAELKTHTKMFCACANDADEREPNKNICPVCMAHPGTLPVINREAVHKVLLVGTALGSTLADYTEFDRKSYFYPDIPKGYQISQYKRPLVEGGTLEGVEITRIHLEEDTARSQHEGDKSLVDYNRGGVPLMELVTEPVIHDAETAGRFARELQLLLRYLGAGEANMEKGEMRVEANISVSKSEKLGTKVEVKNLNSFRSVERAIAYELARQAKVLGDGGTIVQETRGWDETKQVTFSQRKKEGSADYRYFPDPDLPKLLLSEISEFSAEHLKQEISGKLPWEKRARYIALGLKSEDAEMFVRDTLVGDFFDAAAKFLKEPKLVLLAANYIANDIAGEKLYTESNIASLFATLVRMNGEGKLSSRATKDILPYVLRGEDPEQIAKEKGLIQQNDESSMAVVAQKVIDANPTVVADYKAGKEAAMQFLIGHGMKESKGSANPGALRSAIQKILA
ncbi:MAG TPA: Asp-tRNA(Asn)/Glu-tRNA(Gln) amidotransferase subunit GatB [Candidatus Paceibacterota bacterium]|nr:Asp-tRNA(Asn)/Glu-tRNA(Gln) amidotransferase subunit GatB [Candidatus Paceibacterota bacterium]